MTSGLYQALSEEGRTLSAAEAAEIDTSLPSRDKVSDNEGADAAARAADPLLAHQSTNTGIFLQSDLGSVLSNGTGMQITFLSNHASSSGVRAAPSIAVRTLQSAWLFDCGEDTQRTLLGHKLVDWKRVDRIFVTSMSPEAVLGLPGMLCTLSSSRDASLAHSDLPVQVFGPPGLVAFVSSMLSVSRTYLEMPVLLHEFTTRPVPPEQIGQPVEVLRRSRLYAVAVPPDQLNPDGYHDGEKTALINRSGRKNAGTGSDIRAGLLGQQLPKPGDPDRKDVSIGEMTWTIKVDPEWIVTAAVVKSKQPTIAYHIKETPRAGRLYPDVAFALGVEDRDLFTELKQGMPVDIGGGKIVRPEQCVGPPRSGRSMAIVPPCKDSLCLSDNVGEADVVVHAMVDPDGWRVDTEATEERFGAARLAGLCGKAMKAMEVVLWQPFTSLLDDNKNEAIENPIEALTVTKKAFGKDTVSLGGCFDCHQWDRADGDQMPLELPEELRHLIPSNQPSSSEDS